MSSSMTEALSMLTGIQGFIAAAVVDSESGMIFASEVRGDFAIEMAAAANTEVVKSKLQAMTGIGLGDDYIEDILITLGTQYHLIRPLKINPSIFIYLAVSGNGANLGMIRVTMKKAEGSIKSI